MCTVLLPPDDNPIAVNKYIIYNPSGPEADSASKRNEYQEYFLGVKVAGA
jgi:hypothetical protein